MICAFDGPQMVLALVSHEAIVDTWPQRQLNKENHKLLVMRNLDVIGKLVAKKYDAGNVGVYPGTGGQKFPKVIINSTDLAAAKSNLSDGAVLDMAASAGFQRA
jgi:hypothetical protein